MIATYPHCSPVKVYQGLQARFPEADLPSCATVRRYIDTWKRENAQIFLANSNPDAWKSKYMSAAGRTSEGVDRLYQRLEADSTPADILCVDGRYNIVGMIDVFSRQVKLQVTKTSRATAIAALLRRWIIDFGVPEEIKTDNGKDYTSNHLKRAFYDLKIDHKLCPPFMPHLKPHIESFFGTFNHDLLELMPGFIGHNVAERQEIRDRLAFGARMFKKTTAVEAKCTSAELQRFCDDWCAGYHLRPHSGIDGKTPQEIVANWQHPVRKVTNERALDLLLAEAPGGGRGTYTVSKRHLVIQKVDYIAPELAGWIGRKVQVRIDPIDLGRVYVFDEKSQFICVACNPERTGIDRRRTALTTKIIQGEIVKQGKKKLRKAAKEAEVAGIAIEISKRDANLDGKLVYFPKPSEIYETKALLGAAEAAEALLAPAKADPRQIAPSSDLEAQIAAREQAEENRRRIAAEEQWRVDQIGALCAQWPTPDPGALGLSDDQMATISRFAQCQGAWKVDFDLDEKAEAKAFLRWIEPYANRQTLKAV